MPPRTSRRFQDPRIHDWYSSVLGFSDQLANTVLDRFSASSKSCLLDPYCGSGTALIEAQKRGLRAFGLDANPVSVLASQTKTDWTMDLSRVTDTIARFHDESEALCDDPADPIIHYLRKSGMINRGWISDTSAIRAAAIKRWIDERVPKGGIQRLFTLALLATVINDLANVRFGPELYCVAPTSPPAVPETSLTTRLETMVSDLKSATIPRTYARVRYGDARDGRSIRRAATWTAEPVYVLTSPPYPTEHDYTRNSRLELVFLEVVTGSESLRRIKRRMLRSHSKGIYVGDRDADVIRGFQPVERIAEEITDRTHDPHSGFEGQYPKVIKNYFGGMLRHFKALSTYLPSGSRLAYIVGDEASYKGVHIATGHLLAQLIDAHVPGLSVDELVVWRSRRSPRNSPLDENILFLWVT